MTLLDRHLEFVTALRDAGLPVSVAEDLDAAEAIRVLGGTGPWPREQLREAYAAATVKRHVDRPAFDTVFDLFFPPVPGGDAAAAASTIERPPPHRDRELAEFRERLAQALTAGDDAAVARLAREGAGRFGAVVGTAPGRNGWSRYTAMGRISPSTLVASVLGNMIEEGQRGTLAERAARTTIAERIARFERALTADIARRGAELTSPEQTARTAVRPSVDRVDLLSATRNDLVEIRREIQPLARRLAARVAIQNRRGRRGPLDVRRTLRASLSSGGVPVETVHRPRRPARTDLVILCDVSESVSSFARFTLLLVYALREQFSRVRVFAFVDELDEVTDLFAPGADVAEVVTGIVAGSRGRGVLGRTDYGRAFGLFAERHLDAISSRSTLLVLGDARSNYGDLALPALSRMVEPARRAYWLNPERRAAWNTGDSAADTFAELLPMIECRTLAQLGDFVRDLV